MDKQIREYSKRNNKKRILKRVVSLLCVFVLLFTMNTLKRNANTLERIPMCGLIEHIHGSECFNDARELVCGMLEHVHTDACYQQSPTAGGTLDDLEINIDGYDNGGDQSDAGDAQSLDLSLDLSQGDLLDFVQDPRNQAPSNNDQQAGNVGLNEDQAPVMANNAASDGQEAVVEFEDDIPSDAQQGADTTEEEKQPVETEQEQPADIDNIKEETEKTAETETEEAQEQPVETETEGEQEQPAETEEDETEAPAAAETEEAQEQPVETETEGEQEQPVETEEDETEAPAAAETEEAQEQPAETETEGEQEQPVEAEEDETEAPAEDEIKEAQEQPVETEEDEAQSVEIEIEEEQPVETEGETEETASTEEAPQAEPESQVARPAQHFEEGTAYMNVIVDAPEGAFPEGTVMVVKDVQDEGTLRNIEQSVAGDFVEVTSVHAVDISFWYNDTEIEPLLPIAVVMSAVEADAQSETPVVVHVADNGETSVVDSQSIGATEAALEMPATENPEAQAFEADSFSVYAIVGTQALVKNYIDDSGKTWRIKVGYTESAGLPEGARLEVAEIKDSESYMAEAEAALEEGKRITKARFFDIRIMDTDGNEVQPREAVQVTVTMLGDEGEVEADAKQTDVGAPEVLAMHFVERNDEIVKVVSKNATESGDSVTFTAEGFSPWGVVYTVDFEYGGYEFSINGGSGVYLSIVANELKLEEKGFSLEKVANVTFSDPSLIAVERAVNDSDEDDWLLTSLAPFNTDEALTISMNDGNVIVVNVTDSQENLKNFITDAKLTIDGKTYGSGDSWPARPGVDYNLKLTFSEAGSRQFPTGGTEMVMDLIEGLSFKAGMSGSFDIPVGFAGTVTGNTWWIDDQNKLHVKFGSDPDNLINRSSNIHLDLDLVAKFTEGTSQVKFNDKLTDTVTLNNDTDVAIEKNGYYNSEDGKMHYTLTVKSTGKSENVRVQDVISGNLLTLDQESITVTPAKQYNTNSKDSKGFDITFAEMAHDESLTISYTASVQLTELNADGTVKGEDGKNSVTVTNKDNKTDTKTNIINEIKYSDISKISTSSTDKEDGTVELEWKIVANENRRASIAGGTITDIIDWSSKDIMQYAVESEGENAGKLALSVKKIGSGDENPQTVYVDVTPAYAGGPAHWVYNIPNGDGNYTYEITYKTIATKQANTSTVKNTTTNDHGGSDSGAGVVPGTGTGGGGGDVTPGDDLVVAKTATKVTEEYVDWDIVISVPAEGFAKLEVIDKLPYTDIDNQYQIEDYVETLYQDPTVTGLVGEEDFSWTVKRVHGDYSNHHENWDGPDPDNQWLKDANGNYLGHYVLYMDFYKTAADKVAGTNTGLTAVARTVTVKVRTRNNPDWVRFASNDHHHYDTHYNNATVNGHAVSAAATVVKSDVKKTLVKDSPYDRRDGIDLTGPFYYYDIMVSNVTSEPLVIEDSFDTTMLQFVDLEQYPGAWQPAYYVGAGVQTYDNITNGDSAYKATYETTKTGIKITVNKLQKQQNGSYYPYYHVRYYLRLKDGADALLKKQALLNGGTYKIGNTATWNGESDHYDVEYTVPTLSKTGAFKTGNNRRYVYTIKVNDSALQLNGGHPFELTDTHSDNLAVDYSTVVVMKDGAVDTNAEWNFDGNTGTFQLQDGHAYVITYEALIIGNGTQTFSNYVEMIGYNDDDTNSATYSGSVSGGGDIYQIKLLKHENGKTSNGLQGATFQLFRDDGNGGKEPMKYGAGDKIGQNITFTTDADGQALIALNQTDDGNQLDVGVHYYLKEIETPAGYMLRDDSPEYWSFTLTEDHDEVSYGTNGQWIYFCYDDIMKMANVPADSPLDVVVSKQWLDSDGNPLSDDETNDITASVQLLRKTNDGGYAKVKVTGSGDSLTITEVTDDSGVVVLNKDNNWSYRWDDLPRVSGTTKYAYKIEEIEMVGYTVSVTETESETVKTYALKNYKIPKDKYTTAKVQKQWQDAEGNVLPNTTENLPDHIDVYLYQVASREPFAAQPRTGGSKYIKTGDSHLRSEDGTSNDYGVYRLTRAENWAITFTDLPQVITTAEDGTMYYAYYVRELPMTGYTTTYTVDGTTHTIVNRLPEQEPDSNKINIGLTKAWKNGDDTTPPAGASATFVVHQLKSTKSGGGSGNLTVNLEDTSGKVILTRKAKVGDTITITGTGIPNTGVSTRVYRYYYNNEYSYGYAWQYEGSPYLNTDNNGVISWKYTINASDVIDNAVRINVDNDGFLTTSALAWTSGEVTYSDYELTAFAKQVTLPTTSGAWSTTIRNLVQEDEQGNLYKYYITEDSASPETTSVTFKDSNGNVIDWSDNDKKTANAIGTTKSVVVTNEWEPKTADLTVTKRIDKANSATENVTFYVGLFANATATTPIAAGEVGGTNPQPITFTANSADTSKTATFTGLTVGTTYYVFETDSTGRKVTTADKTNGYAIVASDVEGKSVLIQPGGSTAEITNTYSATGSVPFKAKKTLEGGDLTADQFTFTLTEYTDVSFETVKGGGVVQVKKNASNGDIVFDDVELTSIDTRYFKIKETVPTGQDADGSIIYDTHETNVTVTVTDDGKGNLVYAKNPAAVEGYDATFVNTKKGSLTITKAVTVNGQPVTDHSKASLADGTYTFTITGPNSYSHTGEITVTNGAAQNNISLTDLTPGEYIVTEATPTNGTAISKINAAASSVYNTTVTVQPNKTETVAYTNNIETAKLTVEKKWLLNGTPTIEPKKFDGSVISAIEFNLFQKKPGALDGTQYGETYTISRDNDWKIEIDVPKYVWDDTQHKNVSVSYYLQETTALDHYNTTITSNSVTVSKSDPLSVDSDKDVTITNSLYTVALPSTGGVGTGVVYGAGAALILLAVLGLVLMNRKRSRGTGI